MPIQIILDIVSYISVTFFDLKIIKRNFIEETNNIDKKDIE